MNGLGFEIIGKVTEAETIAWGHGVRMRGMLIRRFGPGRWRKLKARARVRLPDGRIVRAEIHFYEAHGVGRRGFKIKRVLSEEE